MRWIAALGIAKAGAVKADPLVISALAMVSAAASPQAVLDSWTLMFWLAVGSLCGVCFVLFGDEKKALTWRSVISKLSVCFIPGFCLTGLLIKLSGTAPSAEVVLAASLLLSVGGQMIVAKLVKKAGDKIDGGAP